MKLYATVTSERATKGQGGNDFLEIEIKAERLRGIPTRANVYRIRLDVVEDELEAYIHDYSTGQRIKLTEQAGIMLEQIREQEKAKKQKGEKCANGYYKPCDVCPKDGRGNCTI